MLDELKNPFEIIGESFSSFFKLRILRELYVSIVMQDIGKYSRGSWHHVRQPRLIYVVINIKQWHKKRTVMQNYGWVSKEKLNLESSTSV